MVVHKMTACETFVAHDCEMILDQNYLNSLGCQNYHLSAKKVSNGSLKSWLKLKKLTSDIKYKKCKKIENSISGHRNSQWTDLIRKYIIFVPTFEKSDGKVVIGLFFIHTIFNFLCSTFFDFLTTEKKNFDFSAKF